MLRALQPLLLLLGAAARGAWAAPEASDPSLVAVVPSMFAEGLRGHLQTAWRIAELEGASEADLATASVLVPGFWRNSSELPSLLGRMPRGQLVQLGMTGTDRLNFSAIPSRFAVCNVHNAVVAIAEYVVAAVLSWNVRLPQMDAAFRRCTWRSAANDCRQEPVHREARGQTVGIVGYGSIGQGVAERAAALGMRAVAVTVPTPSSPPPPLAWIGNDTMLPRLMQEADFVVVTCPLLPATRGLVGAEAIAHMKATGVLINIARGPIVDEAALYGALEGRKIGGAVLDVWWNEDWSSHGAGPDYWPSKFNYSALPNVWMTPHASYHTAGTAAEGIKQMAANFDAFARGEPLRNVVRPATPGQASLPISV